MRQPLTEKRRLAIILYVQAKHNGTVSGVVNLTLKAERMQSDKLYDWLKRNGYQWKRGQWI